jgi:hypothetical protein
MRTCLLQGRILPDQLVLNKKEANPLDPALDADRGISTMKQLSPDNMTMSLTHGLIGFSLEFLCLQYGNAKLTFIPSIMSLLQRVKQEHPYTKSQAGSLPFVTVYLGSNAHLPLPQTSDSAFQPTNHATPTLLRPFSDPKLNAKPWERLLMRTNPVIGPLSPSFSMLKLARASSPGFC